MIPERITLDGFLCYRDRQEIDLAGLTLCMLSGPNGSGKSTVFDAITFALFGTHRGGKRGYEDLVNKRRDSAAVEFEFTCGGFRWLARRTITVKAGSAKTTQGISRRADDGGRWQPVPDTNSVDGCNAWVQQSIGLSSEAFATSMLLRQGRADRLLLAPPKERAELLKAVVGLQRYADLSDRASDRRRLVDARHKAAEAQLNACPAVSDEHVDAAAAALAVAAADAAAADAAVDRLQPVLGQARAWAALSDRLAKATADRRALDALLARRAEMLAGRDRLVELSSVLPHLRAVEENAIRLERSVQAIADLMTGRANAAADVERTKTAAQQAAAAVEQVVHRSADHSHRERELADRLAELDRLLAAAEAAAAHHCHLARLTAERDALPADPSADVDRATGELARLRDVAAAVQWLDLLVEQRADLVACNARGRALASATQARAAEVAAVTALADATGPQAASAERACQAAQQHVADAAAAVAHGRRAVTDLHQADAQADCPTCGQTLTDDHRAAEATRRADREQRATAAHAAAVAALEAAARTRDDGRRSSADVQRRLDGLLADQREADRDARDLAAAVDRNVRGCGKARDNLPASVQPHIPPATTSGEWAATVWPTAADLAALAEEAAAVSVARATLERAERVLSQRVALSAQIAALTLAQPPVPTDLPADLGLVRAEHATVTADRAGLRLTITADAADQKRATVAVRDGQSALDRLTADLHAVDVQLTQEQARHDGYRDAIAAATRLLPPAWADAAVPVAELAAEADELDRAGVVAAAERLRSADDSAALLDRQLAQFRADLSAVPAEARRPPDAVSADLDAAVAARDAARGRHRQSQGAHDDLTRRRAHRGQLADDCRAAAVSLRHHKRLAEMLDRTGLQLHLLRVAERQIVAFANAVLDRLSAGGLTLQLRSAGDGTDQALNLQAVDRRTAAGDVLNVAFLSGSQQFRVAVALALAVGQYAGGGHRLGDCVIIDEGFGSLDRQGQEVMIEELHRLTAIMKRVILVSHQESFADAFKHGYRFALGDDGATRVTPLAAG